MLGIKGKLVNRLKTLKKRKVKRFFLSAEFAEGDFITLFSKTFFANDKEAKIVLGDTKNIILNFEKIEYLFRIVLKGYRRFDKDRYIQQNLDVSSAIASGDIESAEEHFVRCGLKEIILGHRSLPFLYEEELVDPTRFYRYQNSVKALLNLDDFLGLVSERQVQLRFFDVGIAGIVNKEDSYVEALGEFDLDKYVAVTKDVNLPILLGEIISPLEHFLMSGAAELQQGRREYIQQGTPYFYHLPSFDDAVESQLENFKYKPLISVVMPAYNVEPKWLNKAYDSLVKQWYQNWELCICDDASTNEATLRALKQLSENDTRVSVIFSKDNGNISVASNKALELASGDYIALMDNDDELTPDALFEVVKVVQNREISFIYSDEDKIELDGTYTDAHFKPDYSYEMFNCHNYISHLGVIKAQLIRNVGGWRKGFEGAQDYDLYLRVSELEDFNPFHITKVLYHWRKIPGSTASEFGEKSYANEAGRRSLESALERKGIEGSVDFGLALGTYKVNYAIHNEPKVSVIIPFKDKPELLISCLDSLFNNQSYNNFEVICIDNKSSDERIESLKKKYSMLFSNVKFVYYDFPFNYSAINNYAVKHHATGDYVLLMNNDIEVIDDNWLTGLLEYAQLEGVGAVGAKLHYPDDTIQHAGIVITPNTQHGVMSAFCGMPSNSNGYFSRLNSVSNYSAVTAAMLMVSREKYWEVNGLDEEKFKVAYNDIDFCLKLQDLGYRNVFTPYVNAYHHESISRGYEDSFQKKDRLAREFFALQSSHEDIFNSGDPFFSPNLSYREPHFAIGPANTEQAKNYLPQPFEQTILRLKEFSTVDNSQRVCVFSHFDKDNIVDDYVIQYLSALSHRYQIIFVSTAEGLAEQSLSKISDVVSVAIVKVNKGYDFGSWKTGLEYLKDLGSYKELLLCNDSVYGPINSLDGFYRLVDSGQWDVISATDNFEIRYHLQSYFISYSANAITSDVFRRFWDDFAIVVDKNQLIIRNEVNFSQALLNSNLRVTSLVKSEDIGYINNTHFNWRPMLEDLDFPFVKIELLKLNPNKLDISEADSVIGKLNPNMAKAIKKHLRRMTRS